MHDIGDAVREGASNYRPFDHRLGNVGTADDLILDQSLYVILKERYNIEMVTSMRMISVSPASAQDSDRLGLRKYEMALIMRSVSTDTDGKPIEYLISVNHPQRVIFQDENY